MSRQRRHRSLAHRHRRAAERALSREGHFFGNVLWKEKFFPVGSFKDWIAHRASLRGTWQLFRDDPYIGSYYRSDRLKPVASSAFTSVLPKRASF